jgi:hypothetical protein
MPTAGGTTELRRFALIGVQGIVRLAMAALDGASWDALAIAAPFSRDGAAVCDEGDHKSGSH